MRRWFWLLALVVSCGVVCGQAVVKRSSSIITLEGVRYYMHTVSAKETLYSICKAYGVSEKAVEERNPFIASGLRSGQLLFIAADNQSPQPTNPPPHQVPLEAIMPPIIPGIDQPSVEQDSIYFEDIPLGLTATIDQNAPLNVALMLPFGGGNDMTFVDFYRGAIIAIEELKAKGIEVNLTVFSTSSSAQTVSDIIARGELDQANLIIGPVYDKPFQTAAAYATMRRIPIISPLAQVSVSHSPFIVEVAPVDDSKWGKVTPIINDVNSNVVVVDYVANNDSTVVEELASILPYGAQTLTYNGKATGIGAISSLLSRDKNNVIIVPSSNENAVEGLLARLSSINASARYNITVVGTSRWGRFSKIDFELFFKLGVVYPSSYHADRSDSRVSTFYNTYLTEFENLPSLFSFRGYDVAKGFISLLSEHGQRALLELSDYKGEVLQMPYHFEQSSKFDKFVNSAWGLVTYKPDFTIVVL